jgi:hypothetical protein
MNDNRDAIINHETNWDLLASPQEKIERLLQQIQTVVHVPENEAFFTIVEMSVVAVKAELLKGGPSSDLNAVNALSREIASRGAHTRVKK